jgi:hypothetical protein
MTTKYKKLQKRDLIQASLELIKSYNPVTHSVDTHLMDKLGDLSRPVSQ